MSAAPSTRSPELNSCMPISCGVKLSLGEIQQLALGVSLIWLLLGTCSVSRVPDRWQIRGNRDRICCGSGVGAHLRGPVAHERGGPSRVPCHGPTLRPSPLRLQDPWTWAPSTHTIPSPPASAPHLLPASFTTASLGHLIYSYGFTTTPPIKMGRGCPR